MTHVICNYNHIHKPYEEFKLLEEVMTEVGIKFIEKEEGYEITLADGQWCEYIDLFSRVTVFRNKNGHCLFAITCFKTYSKFHFYYGK